MDGAPGLDGEKGQKGERGYVGPRGYPCETPDGIPGYTVIPPRE